MKKGQFYEDLAFYYDFICGDRKKDVDILVELIKIHKQSAGCNLLDVACGTGLEDLYLKEHFTVTGIDLHRGVLDIAKKRNPHLRYERDDMRTFKIDQKFDVITCFDAMAYLPTIEDLTKTLKNFYEHLQKGGVLIFYIDHAKETYEPETLVTTKSENSLHVTLIEDSYSRDQDIAECYLIFVVRKGNTSDVFVDKHSMKLFSVKEIEDIVKKIGFELHLYNTDPEVTFSTEKCTEKSQFPIFVCVK